MSIHVFEHWKLIYGKSFVQWGSDEVNKVNEYYYIYNN